MTADEERKRNEFGARLLAETRAQSALQPLLFWPKGKNSLDAGFGSPGIKFSLMFRLDQTEVILYLDTRKWATNKALFDQLRQAREVIDRGFGVPLDWRRQDGAVADEPKTDVSRVRKIVTETGYLDEEHWPEIQDAMIEAMAQLYQATMQHVERLSA